VLKGFYYIKVLKVLKIIPDRPGNINIDSIKKAGEYFAYIY
jgi:hypothetical protein